MPPLTLTEQEARGVGDAGMIWLKLAVSSAAVRAERVGYGVGGTIES